MARCIRYRAFLYIESTDRYFIMRIPSIIFTLTFAVLVSCSKRRSADGVYVGLEEICSIDSTGKKSCYGNGSPDEKWYHRTTMIILHDTVDIQQVPVHVNESRHDTSYSSSDGGFYNYKGRVQKRLNKIVINLKETSCDHCGEPVKFNADGSTTRIWRIKTYTGSFTDSDLILNGTLFKRTNVTPKASF